MNVSKSNQKIMKTKTLNKTTALFAVVALFSALHGNAQATPNAPTPPTTTSISTSSNSHSITVENNDDVQNNSSVSVSISDDSYKFRARFDNSKNEGIKTLLLKKLGTDNLKINGNTYLWTNQKDGNDVFECKLNKGTLKIYMDKVSTSDAFQNKIVDLGKDLKYYISGKNRSREEAKNAEQAKRDIEKAERDLERAKDELKRAEQAAKKAKEN